MEKLNTLQIGKKKYPYKCDLYVLEELQNEYQNLFEYELKLKGMRPKFDSNGNRIFREDGTFDYERIHFDIHAMNAILPLMVNEGIEINAAALGKEAETLAPEDIIRNIEIPIYDLWSMVVIEYDRCMFGKKNSQTDRKSKAQTR